jgi:energy-coupling factor transporter ATP-binding protein EcfA2
VSILHEIYKWSKDQPEWQQDAIRRLYIDRNLTTTDLEDLYAMAKENHGVEDPSHRVPAKLIDADLAAPSVANRLVQITAIKNLVNVNALAEGQSLTISPTGLTIIYGENGAGKSGYSRVLKKACRARDQAEVILPDARKPPVADAKPQAAFDIIVNGKSVPLKWTGGLTAPEELSEIAIFDAHCARAYVDNEGDFAYAPYGLDILEGLVRACAAIKGMAMKDLAANRPNLEPFAALAKTTTKVGKLLSELSATTKPSDVDELAELTDANVDRLAVLNRALAEADPKQKAQVLRLRATRFTALETRITRLFDAINEAKIKELREVVNKSNSARQAADIAANQFRTKADHLPGTGDEPWKDLFEAARAFATTSHPSHVFPKLTPESRCPLCQNTLGVDGVSRLIDFDTFIQQEAERLAKTAKAAAMAAYQAIADASLDLNIDEALENEIKDAFPNTPDLFDVLQDSMRDRKARVLQAATGTFAWESIPELPAGSCAELAIRASQLLVEAKALEDSMDEKARAAMVAEQAELDARRRLAEIKFTVLDAITKLAFTKKLQACINSITTTGISRKSTDLSKDMATQEVADALNAELKALNVHELQVAMKPESPGGKMQFKLALQLPGGGTPAAILSEGEQRAIAIASFLAEVKLGKGLGGIVFDDPVSSLDHRRRSYVASRIVQEADKRQVIIFTHDIYFLCILQQEAELAGRPATTQCIGRGVTGFGVQTDRLPFDTLSTSKRVKALRQLCDNVSRVHNSGDEAEATRLTREAYSHLRMAWERGVEEVLLQGAVTRFVEGVSTQKLKYVVVEDSDYEAINIGMTKSSKFSGHDPAVSAHLPTPHPDDLRADIDILEKWRASVEARKGLIAARRKL